MLIFGGDGQLGRALTATAPRGAQVWAVDIDQLDITDPEAVFAKTREIRPDHVFNAAAYTAVDRAETDEARAALVNATAVGYIAGAARAAGATLAHVSTDFVFDGESGRGYAPSATPSPINAYGRTKLAGETAAGLDALIIRTAWVYGPTGNNFVRTMLRLMAANPTVRVVSDQVGTPTFVVGLAGAIWSLALRRVTGLLHYTDSGVASWYDFAVAIQEEALAAGLLDTAAEILPISSADYPTPARRPHFSVLDKRSTFELLGSPAPHWRVNLRTVIAGIRQNG